MKTEFNQQNGLLTMQGMATEPKDRSLLREFFQHEIQGYDHSLQYRYNEAEDSYTMQFVPTLTQKNILKETDFEVEDIGGGTVMYVKVIGNIRLYVYLPHKTYEFTVLNPPQSIEVGVVGHIYHLRELLKKANGLNGKYPAL